jgi:hypothetical protein
VACVSPPELTVVQLSLFLDGEADALITDHVQRCPTCRTNALRLARLQHPVQRALYRGSCPSAEQLCNYQAGLLSKVQAKATAAHLMKCPHCSRELLIDYGEEPPASPAIGIFDQLRLWIAQLLPPSPDPLTPAYQLRDRGQDQPHLYYYVAGEVQISISIEDEPNSWSTKQLTGLIAGIENHDLQVHLWQGEQLCALTVVDDAGTWTIPHQAPGAYEVMLHSSQVKIRVPDLQI